MSSAAIRAGQAYVEIGAKTGPLDKALLAVQGKMRAFASSAAKITAGLSSVGGGMQHFGKSTMGIGSAIAGLGAAGMASVVAMTTRFAEAGGAIDDMRGRTGLAAEEISGLSYAAQMSGTSIEGVEKAIRHMQKSGTGAGNGTMNDFLELATQISAIEDPAKRTSEAMRVFGKAGADLLPMMEGGGAGIRGMMKEAEKLGLVMSGPDAQAAAVLGDSLDRMWKVIGSIATVIGATFAPTLTSMADGITAAAGVVRMFIDDHRDFIVMAAKVAAGLAAAGAALLAFGASVTAIGVVVSGFVTALGMIGTVLGVILSPIGLVTAAVVGLGAAIVYHTGAGSTAMKYLQEKWQQLKDFAMPIIEGIKNALMQGKWGEAAQIAMLALQIAFRTGLEPIYTLWTDLQTWMSTTAIGVVTTIANVFAGIPTALMNGFSIAITWLTGAWDTAVNAIAKKLLYLYSLIDKSLDYEKAAKQMDSEAAGRAQARQRAMDEAIARRNKDLDNANMGRLKAGASMTQGITSAAADRKAAFGSITAGLKGQMASMIASVNASAATANAAAAKDKPQPATMASLLGLLPGGNLLKKGFELAQNALNNLPSSGTNPEIAETPTVGTTGTFSGFAAGMIAGSPLAGLVDVNKKQLETLRRIEEKTGKPDPTQYE